MSASSELRILNFLFFLPFGWVDGTVWMNPIGDGGDLRAYASTSSFREATVETNSVQSIIVYHHWITALTC